jgi:p-hydroxybenzoate 3-monooxygenase
MRTQVGIIGAGPAGLMLSHLLHRAGIESVIIEGKSRAYCEGRIRAGVLEHGTIELLKETGLGERMLREGLAHNGIYLRFNGKSHHLDFTELTGKQIMVYGQHEVVKDLIAARLAAGAEILFESTDVKIERFDTAQPSIRFHDTAGNAQRLSCDFIAGCDGFHGLCRPSIPTGVSTFYDRIYPFAWLGILADAPPVCEELIYANTDRGFALFSQRSPSVQRYYLQCRPDEDIDEWPDERIWYELQARLQGEDAPQLIPGEITQKGVTAMRSFVAEPMQYGRLFLAGDSAHIVPPTGAKGMNLAIADVVLLAQGLDTYYHGGSMTALDSYSDVALNRVWKMERFSWWMTSMLHKFDDQNPFDRKVQLAELDYVTSSHVAAQSLAENYVGLPMSTALHVSR